VIEEQAPADLYNNPRTEEVARFFEKLSTFQS